MKPTVIQSNLLPNSTQQTAIDQITVVESFYLSAISQRVPLLGQAKGGRGCMAVCVCYSMLIYSATRLRSLPRFCSQSGVNTGSLS